MIHVAKCTKHAKISEKVILTEKNINKKNNNNSPTSEVGFGINYLVVVKMIPPKNSPPDTTNLPHTHYPPPAPTIY